MKALPTIILLVLANVFMTTAWYGHLRFGKQSAPLIVIILASWAIAFFEYCLQIPANRLGFAGNGGPFSLIELKILQEVITLAVFTIFTLLVFRNETFRANHIISFLMLIGAVYFAFKK